MELGKSYEIILQNGQTLYVKCYGCNVWKINGRKVEGELNDVLGSPFVSCVEVER